MAYLIDSDMLIDSSREVLGAIEYLDENDERYNLQELLDP